VLPIVILLGGRLVLVPGLASGVLAQSLNDVQTPDTPHDDNL